MVVARGWGEGNGELVFHGDRVTVLQDGKSSGGCKGEGGGGGRNWEFGVSRCKLLHVEWINNKVLLYSTGNSIQYPRINHNGEEYNKGVYKLV